MWYTSLELCLPRWGSRIVLLCFFQAEDGIRDVAVTGVQTCALPILADRFARRERLGDGPVEVQEHRVLVAREPLGADRAFRRALFGQPAEARHDEAAPLEELRDKSEREHAPQAEAPRLRDACQDELPADPASRRLGAHGERADLGEVGRQHRERAATEEAGGVPSDEEIAE